MKKNFLLLLFLLIIITGCKNKQDTNRILYSWHMKNISDKDLIKVVNKLGINTIYQDFETDYLNGNNNDFIKQMKDNNINVYHLSGDPSWGIKGSNKTIDEINKVITYNKNNKYKISGIVFDIESYTLDNFDEIEYLNIIKKTYKYAKKNSIYMIICIPTWMKKNYLDQLIINTDEISIMNYNIKNTTKNIKEEVEIAKKHNKKINTIYEINFNNKKYFSSYDKINDDYEKIVNSYNYPIGVAFHHYNSIGKFAINNN